MFMVRFFRLLLHVCLLAVVKELRKVREVFSVHDRGLISMKGKGEIRVYIVTGFLPRMVPSAFSVLA